jgi:hypothetical protein
VTRCDLGGPIEPIGGGCYLSSMANHSDFGACHCSDAEHDHHREPAEIIRTSASTPSVILSAAPSATTGIPNVWAEPDFLI